MLAALTASIPVSWWILFNAFVVFMLALDLGVFNRKAHVVKVKEALGWTAVWIALAMAFNVWVGWKLGGTAAKEFLAGYILEKSLSVDNVFVFAVIFSFFKVPREYQHKVLFWGIFGALVVLGGGKPDYDALAELEARAPSDDPARIDEEWEEKPVTFTTR